MDPVSALGIAAAVVQFVEYAAKACRKVKRLYETLDEDNFGNIAFEKTALDFVEFSTVFKARLPSDGDAGKSNDEVNLRNNLYIENRAITNSPSAGHRQISEQLLEKGPRVGGNLCKPAQYSGRI
jgi:hypothetical protein